MPRSPSSLLVPPIACALAACFSFGFRFPHPRVSGRYAWCFPITSLRTPPRSAPPTFPPHLICQHLICQLAGTPCHTFVVAPAVWIRRPRRPAVGGCIVARSLVEQPGPSEFCRIACSQFSPWPSAHPNRVGPGAASIDCTMFKTWLLLFLLLLAVVLLLL